jgi:hypothetical protein
MPPPSSQEQDKTMVTHAVLFKLSEPTTEHLEATRNVLTAMPEHIPQLRYIEVGMGARHDEGAYDLALLTRFDDWADLEAYKNHPYHVDVVNSHLREVLADRCVVDWESE